MLRLFVFAALAACSAAKITPDPQVRSPLSPPHSPPTVPPQAVAKLVGCLASGHAANRLELESLGVIPHLIALLSSVYFETQAHAAMAIAKLTSGEKQDVSWPPLTTAEEHARQLRTAVSKAGALSPLLSLIEMREGIQYLKYLNAQRNSVHALAMLATN